MLKIKWTDRITNGEDFLSQFLQILLISIISFITIHVLSFPLPSAGALFRSVTSFYVGPLAQSVYRLATGWTVRGSNPGGGEIFRTCPDRPWGLPSLLYNG
jgi:hypothetical protein